MIKGFAAGFANQLCITAYWVRGGVWPRTSRQFLAVLTFRKEQSHTHPQPHIQRQFRVTTPTNLHVFGLWEEHMQTRGEHANTTHTGVEKINNNKKNL